jgi:hypothetical protein
MNDIRQKLLNSFERLEIVATNKSDVELIRAIEKERVLLIGLIDGDVKPKLFERARSNHFVN